MRPGYRQLIEDHEAIEAAAIALLSDLKDPDVSAEALSLQLVDLARVVEDHIAVEGEVVNGVDPSRLNGPWVEAWHDGMAAFERLRRDWIAFIYRWSTSTIEGDRTGFQRDAEAILGSLRERVQLETRAFYATALQVGAVALR